MKCNEISVKKGFSHFITNVLESIMGFEINNGFLYYFYGIHNYEILLRGVQNSFAKKVYFILPPTYYLPIGVIAGNRLPTS